ncbi:MAG: ribosome maturation factor RimM [Firmicutes bacterium]|nr:ribosome maturation factor RimM [Bacillota bacterium]
MEEEMFTVGVITGTHGLRGDVKVLSRTDFPELRFVQGAHLWLVPAEGSRTAPREVVVRTAQSHNRVYIVSFEGYLSIDDVQAWRGSLLRVRRQDLPPLPQGEYFIRDLIGCAVYTEDGNLFGELVDVLTPGANDVYVVQTSLHGSVLLPAIPQCILHVDISTRRMDVRLLPGLLD